MSEIKTPKFDDQIQLTTAQAAKRHGLSPCTFRRWRVDGVGPRYRRINPSLVLYDKSELDRFFCAGPDFQSTTEEGVQ